MLLAIDIGNTNITLGVFKTSAQKDVVKASRAARIFSAPAKAKRILLN